MIGRKRYNKEEHLEHIQNAIVLGSTMKLNDSIKNQLERIKDLYFNMLGECSVSEYRVYHDCVNAELRNLYERLNQLEVDLGVKN